MGAGAGGLSRTTEARSRQTRCFQETKREGEPSPTSLDPTEYWSVSWLISSGVSVPIPIIDRLLRVGEGRILKKLEVIAKQVNAIEEDFEKLTDAELRGETDVFRKRLADGESLDDILPEAFAAVREASRRTLGKRHFDVQIMGGAALHLLSLIHISEPTRLGMISYA